MRAVRFVVFGVAIASGGIAAYLDAHVPSATAARAPLAASEPTQQARLIKAPDTRDVPPALSSRMRPTPLELPPDMDATGSIAPGGAAGSINIVRFGVSTQR